MSVISILLFLITPLVMVAGLIKPSLISKITSKTLSRKQILGWFTAATFGFLVLAGLTEPPKAEPEIKQAESSPTPTSTTTTTPEIQQTPIEVSQNEKLLGTSITEATPASTPTPTPKITPAPTQKPVVVQQSTTPIPNQSSDWACNCSKTCDQMSSCAEAQYQLNICGCGRRDADNDGIACDSDCQ